MIHSSAFCADVILEILVQPRVPQRGAILTIFTICGAIREVQ